LVLDKSADNYFSGIRLQSGGTTNWDIGTIYNDKLSISETAGGSPKVTVLPNGNVGIGTTNPVEMLHLAEANAKIRVEGSWPRIYLYSNSSGVDEKRWDFYAGNGTFHLQTRTDGGSHIRDVMSFFRNGNVGIGTEWPAPTEKLEVNGCIKHNSGTLGTGCSSDIRMKKEIRDVHFENALNKLSELRPRSFKFKDGGGNRYYGLIAQEVETVSPELVGSNEDGLRTVDYEGLRWMTLQAIRELKAENDMLLAKMSDQQAQLADLREEIRTLKAGKSRN
jgi:hypothetical protein